LSIGAEVQRDILLNTRIAESMWALEHTRTLLSVHGSMRVRIIPILLSAHHAKVHMPSMKLRRGFHERQEPPYEVDG
jgi:hypothetical protein